MTTTLTASGITFNDATSQTTTGVEIPTGTLMLFVQSTAPTGWTKQTTHNDKALRVVSGSVSSGGSVAFSTAFADGLSANATTLSSTQIPSHTHNYSSWTASTIALGSSSGVRFAATGTTDGGTGGSGSHTHSLPSFAVQYVDVIICTKN